MNKDKVLKLTVKADIFPLRVYYEDTDAGGIVYHANYLKFFERARTEFIISRVQTLTSIQARFGLSFVVKSINLEYFQPARLEEKLDVLTKLVKIGAASFVFEQSICRAGHDRPLCAATIVLVAINSALKPSPIPETLKQELQREC